MCIIFSVGENVNSVWYLNVVMLYIYIYICAVYFAREKTWGNRRCLFKMHLSPWFFYLSSIKRKFNVTFIHGSMIFNNIQFNSSCLKTTVKKKCLASPDHFLKISVVFVN